jgi:SAM-dependent MidA family methyltransferase/signal transduction histidine kinase/SAM-dependent methyltransferase
MKKKFPRILYFLLCFLLVFEQSGFAQLAGQLDISGYFSGMQRVLVPDKFHPIHLRSIGYDGKNNDLRLILDKGDLKFPKTQEIEDSTRGLLDFFFIGISLPNDSFWVNLRPDSPDNIIDGYLAKTDLGKVLLEADLQLKKDTANLTSPQTAEGKDYWDKLYRKANELFAGENVSIPTLTRPWIVPDEIIVRSGNKNAYVYKATLKVMLEQDYLTGSATYNFNDDRLKELNEYASELIRKNILPKLTKDVNTAKRYAALRQAYYSLILAQWFKQNFSGKNGPYSRLIDQRDLTNLISKQPWSKETYFQAYKKSFQDGEYNIKEQVYTPQGKAIRTYMSGGIALGPEIATAIGQGQIVAAKGLPGDLLKNNIVLDYSGEDFKVSNLPEEAIESPTTSASGSSSSPVKGAPGFFKAMLASALLLTGGQQLSGQQTAGVSADANVLSVTREKVVHNSGSTWWFWGMENGDYRLSGKDSLMVSLDNRKGGQTGGFGKGLRVADVTKLGLFTEQVNQDEVNTFLEDNKNKIPQVLRNNLEQVVKDKFIFIAAKAFFEAGGRMETWFEGGHYSANPLLISIGTNYDDLKVQQTIYHEFLHFILDKMDNALAEIPSSGGLDHYLMRPLESRFGIIQMVQNGIFSPSNTEIGELRGYLSAGNISSKLSEFLQNGDLKGLRAFIESDAFYKNWVHSAMVTPLSSNAYNVRVRDLSLQLDGGKVLLKVVEDKDSPDSEVVANVYNSTDEDGRAIRVVNVNCHDIGNLTIGYLSAKIELGGQDENILREFIKQHSQNPDKGREYVFSESQIQDLAYLAAYNANIFRQLVRLAVAFSENSGKPFQETFSDPKYEKAFFEFLKEFNSKIESDPGLDLQNTANATLDKLGASSPVKSANSITEVIQNAIINGGGKITTAEFMDLALYDPDYGYYTSQVRIGYGMDFSTAAEDPMFGVDIARQIFQMWELMGKPRKFNIVEMGAGNGVLARNIISFLQAWRPYRDLYDALEYIIVDRSPLLKSQQWITLSDFPGKVRWVEGSAFDLSGLHNVEGVFLSNELPDTFAVHRIRAEKSNSFKEVYVSSQNGKFQDSLGELSDPRMSDYINSLLNKGVEFKPGDEFAVNLNLDVWQDQMSRALKRGYIITIDYGGTPEQIMNMLKRQGNNAVWGGGRGKGLNIEDTYKKFEEGGAIDVTSFVDYDELAQLGQKHGLSNIGVINQLEFMRNIQRWGAFSRQEYFKVLIQGRGIDVSAKLVGLTGPSERTDSSSSPVTDYKEIINSPEAVLALAVDSRDQVVEELKRLADQVTRDYSEDDFHENAGLIIGVKEGNTYRINRLRPITELEEGSDADYIIPSRAEVIRVIENELRGGEQVLGDYHNHSFERLRSNQRPGPSSADAMGGGYLNIPGYEKFIVSDRLGMVIEPELDLSKITMNEMANFSPVKSEVIVYPYIMPNRGYERRIIPINKIYLKNFIDKASADASISSGSSSAISPDSKIQEIARKFETGAEPLTLEDELVIIHKRKELNFRLDDLHEAGFNGNLGIDAMAISFLEECGVTPAKANAPVSLDETYLAKSTIFKDLRHDLKHEVIIFTFASLLSEEVDDFSDYEAILKEIPAIEQENNVFVSILGWDGFVNLDAQTLAKIYDKILSHIEKALSLKRSIDELAVRDGFRGDDSIHSAYLTSSGNTEQELKLFIATFERLRNEVNNPGIRKPLDINASIGEIVNVYSKTSNGYKYNLNLDDKVNSLPVSANDLQLSCIWKNFISNARDADGREISFTSGVVEKEGKKFIRVTVADNGKPIPQNMLNDRQLFREGVSTKNKNGGTGLYLVDQIVKYHNGIIEAHSGENGPKFVIDLPVMDSAASSVRSANEFMVKLEIDAAVNSIYEAATYGPDNITDLLGIYVNGITTSLTNYRDLGFDFNALLSRFVAAMLAKGISREQIIQLNQGAQQWQGMIERLAAEQKQIRKNVGAANIKLAQRVEELTSGDREIVIHGTTVDNFLRMLTSGRMIQGEINNLGKGNYFEIAKSGDSYAISPDRTEVLLSFDKDAFTKDHGLVAGEDFIIRNHVRDGVVTGYEFFVIRMDLPMRGDELRYFKLITPNGVFDLRNTLVASSSPVENSDYSVHVASLEVMLDFIKEFVPEVSVDDLISGKILDIGMETNSFSGELMNENITTYLSAKGKDVIGLDPHPGLAQKFSGRGKFVSGIAQKMPFGENEFNTVISVGLFNPEMFDLAEMQKQGVQTLPDFYNQSAKEMRRVLKDGGVALLSTGPATDSRAFVEAFSSAGFVIHTMPFNNFVMINNKSGQSASRLEASSPLADLPVDFNRLTFDLKAQKLYLDNKVELERLCSERVTNNMVMGLGNVAYRIFVKQGQSRASVLGDFNAMADRRFSPRVLAYGFTHADPKEGHYCIAVQRVWGDSLDVILKRQGSLSEKQKKQFFDLFDAMIADGTYLLDTNSAQFMIGYVQENGYKSTEKAWVVDPEMMSVSEMTPAEVIENYIYYIDDIYRKQNDPGYKAVWGDAIKIEVPFLTMIRDHILQVAPQFGVDPADLQASSPVAQNGLSERLRQQIKKSGGRVNYADFMQTALYDQDYGYYTKFVNITKDFDTDSEHIEFGNAMADQLYSMWSIMGEPSDFRIVEMGVGRGTLAKNILEYLSKDPKAKDLYKTLKYIIVDVSDHLKAIQAQSVSAFPEKVEWKDLTELKDIQGVFISNELIDAFPVRIIKKQNGQFREVFVSLKEDGLFTEELGEISTQEIKDYVRGIVSVSDGQEIPFSPYLSIWSKQVAKALKRGFVITADYGVLDAGDYASHENIIWSAKGDTIKNARKRIYNQIASGRSIDITWLINFADLSSSGQGNGLNEVSLFSLRDSDFSPASRSMEVAKYLSVSPDFRMLMQEKGVFSPEASSPLSKDLPVNYSSDAIVGSLKDRLQGLPENFRKEAIPLILCDLIIESLELSDQSLYINKSSAELFKEVVLDTRSISESQSTRSRIEQFNRWFASDVAKIKNLAEQELSQDALIGYTGAEQEEIAGVFDRMRSLANYNLSSSPLTREQMRERLTEGARRIITDILTTADGQRRQPRTIWFSHDKRLLTNVFGISDDRLRYRLQRLILNNEISGSAELNGVVDGIMQEPEISLGALNRYIAEVNNMDRLRGNRNVASRRQTRVKMLESFRNTLLPLAMAAMIERTAAAKKANDRGQIEIEFAPGEADYVKQALRLLPGLDAGILESTSTLLIQVEQFEGASSPIADNKGGIDFRALPIATQPVINLQANSMPVPGQLVNVDLNESWGQIENMLNAGIVPSSERIKEYLQSCINNKNEEQEISKVLLCIAGILRLQEDQVVRTDAALKEMLALLESNESAGQMRLALANIKIGQKGPLAITR